MKPLLLYILEVLFCSGMLLAFYHLLLVRKVAYVYCRRYLVASMVLSVVIPALDIPLYPARTVVYPLPLIGRTVAEPAFVAEVDAATAAAVPSAIAPATDWRHVANAGAGALYALTSLLLLGIFAVRIRSIRRLRRHSRLTRYPAYTVAENPQVTAPFSFLRTIFIGDTPAERELVLAHEASHVRRRHSAERITMEILRCLLWLNPFVWMASRWLQEVQEWEADRDVLDAGYDLTQYRTILFQQLFGYNPDIACGLNHSLTKNRFAMMTQFKEGKFAFVRLGAAVPVVAAMMLLCSFTIRTPDPGSQKPVPVGAHASAASVISGLETLKPIPFHVKRVGYSVEGRFDLLDFLPVDDSKYKYENGKVTDLKGKDISWWAEKHYYVQSKNPVFVIDGVKMNKDEYVAYRDAIRKERGDRHVSLERTDALYAGPEVGKLLGDPTVDALVISYTGESSGGTESRVRKFETASKTATVHISADKIIFNGKQITKEQLSQMISDWRESLPEEQRPEAVITLKADPQTPMSTVTDVKQTMRKAKTLKVNYASDAGDQLRMLPPDPSTAGVSVVMQVVPEGAKVSSNGDIRIKARNLLIVQLDNQGQVTAGTPGNMKPASLAELAAKVREFVLNSSSGGDQSEQQEREFTLPDGSKISYPVSQGVVSLQTMRSTPYDSYVEVQRVLANVYEGIRNDLSQKWFSKPYTDLASDQAEVVKLAVPLKIAEAEPLPIKARK